jgi:hypothetical protein
MSNRLGCRLTDLTSKIIVFLAAFSVTTFLSLTASSHDVGWRYSQSAVKFQN